MVTVQLPLASLGSFTLAVPALRVALTLTTDFPFLMTRETFPVALADPAGVATVTVAAPAFFGVGFVVTFRAGLPGFFLTVVPVVGVGVGVDVCVGVGLLVGVDVCDGDGLVGGVVVVLVGEGPLVDPSTGAVVTVHVLPETLTYAAAYSVLTPLAVELVRSRSS